MGAASDSKIPMPIPADYPTIAQVLTQEPNAFLILQRNKNTNTVVYAVNIKDGAIDPADPIKVYWIMYAAGGHTEGLTLLERNSAYGVTVKPAAAGHYEVVLASLKTRVLDVYLGPDGKPVTASMVAGKPALLNTVFVQAKSGWGLPTVDFVEISGTSLESGEALVEQLKP
eukprot:c8989_g1_i1.p1 GENE.c8989_g1_i1~~c8989_g1_i1.p1  ORF type:complete len:171 (-),score=31.29 c8989_g1_i1:53-565(-)